MLSKLTFSAVVIVVVGVLPASAQTYTVCETDDPGGCKPHQVATGCGSIDSWAQSACKVRGSDQPAKYTLVKIGDSPGGQCGHALFQVTCK